MKKIIALIASLLILGSIPTFVFAYTAKDSANQSENTVELSSENLATYSSSASVMSFANGALSSTDDAEQKTMITNLSTRVLDVSFTLKPSVENGRLNGGLYFFASNVGNAQDEIDALNVNVDKNPDDDHYKVYIYNFSNGAYSGFVSNTVALKYDGAVEVRVIIDAEEINVYLEGSDIPSITKKVKSTTHAGSEVGFRSQFASQIFEDLKVSLTPAKPENKTVKVLMIGNSYAQDTMTYAHEIAKAEGINMVCGVLYYGGCTVKQHTQFIAEKKSVYTYFKNGGTDREKVDFFSVLEDEDWDIITIQTGQGQQGLKDTFYPYLPQLITLVETLKPSAEVGLFQSWAVPKCYEGTNNSRLSAYEDNSEKMYQAIISTFADLKAENGVSFVIPSAEVLHRIDGSAICDNADAATSFFRDSTAHVNEKGRYMLGLTIFQSVTGIKASGNAFEPIGYTYGGDRAPLYNDRVIIQSFVDEVFADPAYKTVNFFGNEELVPVKLVVENAQTEYKAGQYFNYATANVYVVYNDGSREQVTYFYIDIMRKLTVEDSQIVISYQNVSTTLEITVE